MIAYTEQTMDQSYRAPLDLTGTASGYPHNHLPGLRIGLHDGAQDTDHAVPGILRCAQALRGNRSHHHTPDTMAAMQAALSGALATRRTHSGSSMGQARRSCQSDAELRQEL